MWPTMKAITRYGIIGQFPCPDEPAVPHGLHISYSDALGLVQGNCQERNRPESKVTAVLSVLFLSVVLTGFALLGIEGAGSPVGQCHFWAGIVTTVLSIGHILKRLPLLRKSLK